MPAERPVSNGAVYPAVAAPEKTSIDVGEIFNTIRQGKWIILVTCMLISAGIVAYKFTETPLFEASSLVSIASNKSSTTSPTDRLSAYSVNVYTQADELSFLNNSGELSRRVAQRLIEVADALGSNAYFSVLHAPEGSPPLTLEEIALRIRIRVLFMPSEQNMITIKAISPSQVEAVRLANLYAQEYQLMDKERSRARLVQARQFVQELLSKRREELAALDYRWEAMFSNSETISGGSTGELFLTQYATLTADLESKELQLETEKRSRDHLVEEYERVAPGLVEQVSSGIDREITALQDRIAELKMDAEEYYIHDPSRRGREAEIPELNEIIVGIKNLEERKNSLAQQLVRETLSAGNATTRGTVEPLSYATQLKAQILTKDITINELTLTVSALRRRVAEAEKKLRIIPTMTLERQQLERERAVVEQGYKTLQSELQQAEIAEQSDIGNVSIIREAQQPLPVGSDLTQSLILGLLLGLGFGTGLAFVRKAVDRRVARPADVRDMGFQLVGVIPEMQRDIKESHGGSELVEYNGAQLSAHLVAALQPTSSIAENYRLTRTNIDFLFEDNPPQVVLITSPEAGDGKTVTSVNLAITMAESGRRTLLIDLDLRRPSCHKLMGRDRAPGFVDLLTHPGEFLLEEFETTIPYLHFVPAGSTSSRPSELVGSSLLKDGINSLREMFDTIIIDSPPVLAVTDAVVLSTICDATVVVVNADATDQQALNVTRQTLEAVGVSVSGVILNRFDARRAGMKGYYIYGYDSSYSYDQPVSNGARA
ncbi:MAG: polysaccharide biosynthesis tyrosine autokinase [Rhodothermales bacterium]